MKRTFNHILESVKKKRGVDLLILMIFLVSASTFLVSCTGHNSCEVEADSILEQPAYHLAPYRSEFALLFYETPERIGFQVLDGIFLFNYKENRMEADFALSEGSFEPGYAISPAMSSDEKSIIIEGFDPSDGTKSKHFYQYDIAHGKISRIEGEATEVATLPYPAENRQLEAFQAETWALEDIRYYPEGDDTFYIPFKSSNLPTVTYEMQDIDSDIPFAPKLTLLPDGRFNFIYSLLSSYLNYGKYEITGTEYNMVTGDGKHTFIFHKKGDHLVFDAERSARCTLDDGTELPNGAEFSVKQ